MAVVLVGVLVTGGIVVMGYGATSKAITLTTTVTSTYTTTQQAAMLHGLTFQQTCYSGIPWEVALWNDVIGNLTLTNPPNTTVVPGQAYSHDYSNFTSLVFTVPQGYYDYRVVTPYGMDYGQATVLLADTTIQVCVPPAFA